jgi:hypothetical protein
MTIEPPFFRETNSSGHDVLQKEIGCGVGGSEGKN